MSSDRRRSERVSLRKYFVLYSKDSWLSFLRSKPGTSAALVNVGEGGVQILTQEPVPVLTGYSFHIKAKQMADAVEFKGIVAWCKRIPGKDFYQVGVKFSKPNSGLAADIDKLVEEHNFNAKVEKWKRQGGIVQG
ncbi:MAG: PilZ domain-containing protein [Planctomycetes bacterium]|nr:PilZ domain-containing protein [Planctomycetota bacterium]